jgi:membrane protease YdiL (CAAX protease family)
MKRIIALGQLIWKRLPIPIRAIVSGLFVAATGTIPWSVLTYLNITYNSAFPWAILFMAIYLVLFWEYWGGYGWPKSTQEQRKLHRRSKKLSFKTWFRSLLFGGLAFGSLYTLIAVVQRLLSLPVQPSPEHLEYPMVTIIGLFLMGNIVTGLVEETSFRGYMQTPLESKYGITISIIIVGLIFGLIHFSHSWMSLRYLPIYIIISAIYGILVYTTGSILPGAVLHVAGNTISGIYLKLKGPIAAPTLIWTTGPDISFWINLILSITFCTLALAAYSKLRDVIGR